MILLALCSLAFAQEVDPSGDALRSGALDDSTPEVDKLEVEEEEEDQEGDEAEEEEEVEEDEEDEDEEEDDDSSGVSRAPGNASYVMPDPPAMTVLSQDPSDVSEPSSPTDFAVAAGTFFDDDGTLKPGGAIEVGLRALGASRRITRARYRESWTARAWSRTYLSAATTLSDDRADIHAAFGLRTVLLDGADPLLARDYDEAVALARAECEELRKAGELEEYQECIEGEYLKRAKKLERPAWNAPGLVFSAAWVQRFEDKKYKGLNQDTLASWLSVTGPAGDAAQLGMSAGWAQALDDSPHELPTIGMVRLGLRGSRLNIQGGHVAVLPQDGSKPSSRIPLSFGGEFQADDELWLQFKLGLVLDPGSDVVTMLSSTSFQWGQASEPSFSPNKK